VQQLGLTASIIFESSLIVIASLTRCIIVHRFPRFQPQKSHDALNMVQPRAHAARNLCDQPSLVARARLGRQEEAQFLNHQPAQALQHHVRHVGAPLDRSVRDLGAYDGERAAPRYELSG